MGWCSTEPLVATAALSTIPSSRPNRAERERHELRVPRLRRNVGDARDELGVTVRLDPRQALGVAIGADDAPSVVPEPFGGGASDARCCTGDDRDAPRGSVVCGAHGASR